MSFSSEVKEELAKQFGRSRHCQIAELAGILELEGMLDEGGKLVVSNENSLLQTNMVCCCKKYLERNRRFYRSCRRCAGIMNRTGPGK